MYFYAVIIFYKKKCVEIQTNSLDLVCETFCDKSATCSTIKMKKKCCFKYKKKGVNCKRCPRNFEVFTQSSKKKDFKMKSLYLN